MTTELEKFRLDALKNNLTGNTFASCLDASNTSRITFGANKMYEFNLTIKDYNTEEYVKSICKTKDEYVNYYRSLLTDEYIDAMPDDFIKGMDKKSVKKEVKKLRDSIENTKKQAESFGMVNKFGEYSLMEDWNVENCAEIWTSRNAILEGAKFDDLIIRTVNREGVIKELCKNCEITFYGHYLVD